MDVRNCPICKGKLTAEIVRQLIKDEKIEGIIVIEKGPSEEAIRRHSEKAMSDVFSLADQVPRLQSAASLCQITALFALGLGVGTLLNGDWGFGGLFLVYAVTVFMLIRRAKKSLTHANKQFEESLAFIHEAGQAVPNQSEQN